MEVVFHEESPKNAAGSSPALYRLALLSCIFFFLPRGGGQKYVKKKRKYKGRMIWKKGEIFTVLRGKNIFWRRYKERGEKNNINLLCNKKESLCN